MWSRQPLTLQARCAQELQRSRQIIQSRLQGAPAHAAHAWPAMGGAAPADDLQILMPEFDPGQQLQLGGLLATSPPGRKRGWASLAGDDAWPAQQAQRPQHGGPRGAPGLGGWNPAPAEEERLWAAGPQALAWQQQQRQGGGLGVQDPGELRFDPSGESRWLGALINPSMICSN